MTELVTNLRRLNVTPASGVKQQMAAAINFRQSTYGNLQTPANFVYAAHGLASVNCNHLLVHQCPIRGFAVQGSGADATF
jgi:hypothetical protein